VICEMSKRAISAWRNFINSPHGQEGLAWWKDQRPRVGSDPVLHLFAKSAGSSDGFDSAIDKLEEMLIDEPEKSGNTDPEPERLDISHITDKK